MEYSIKQQAPYIIAEFAICMLLNIGTKGCCCTLFETLSTLIIVIVSLGGLRYLPKIDSEFAIKNAFRKYVAPMIYLPLSMIGWQWYTYKHITLWQVPMYFLGCIMIFVIIEKSLYD